MMIYFEYREKIIPYTRMTQRGKFVDKRAQQYLASKESLAWAMLQHRQTLDVPPDLVLFDKVPFLVDISYHAPRLYTFDADNILKAVLDAGNGILWSDDRYCIHVQADKYQAPEYHMLMTARGTV